MSARAPLLLLPVSMVQVKHGMARMSVDLSLHADLKQRLRQTGSSLTDIANKLGVLQSTVTVVSQGYRKSHRIQDAIAKQLGTTPQALFPDRYLGGAADPNQNK